MCRLSWNLGASTSWNAQDMSMPVMGLLCHTDSLKLRGTWTLRNRVVHHSNGDYCRNAESKQAACCVSCNGPRQNTCTARFLLLPWLAFLSIILARTHCVRLTHTWNSLGYRRSSVATNQMNLLPARPTVSYKIRHANSNYFPSVVQGITNSPVYCCSNKITEEFVFPFSEK